MLVPDKRPPAKPPVSNAPKNDASMWMQAPVSADDFVSAPRKKPVAPGGGGRGLMVGVLVAAFAAVSAAGVYFAFIKESPKSTASYASPSTPGSAAPTTPAVATTAADAAVATATPDAAVAAATPDAGAAQMVGGLQVDAISAADPAVKKTKKRPATKKKPVKKKTATAPKRRK